MTRFGWRCFFFFIGSIGNGLAQRDDTLLVYRFLPQPEVSTTSRVGSDDRALNGRFALTNGTDERVICSVSEHDLLKIH